MTKITNNIKTPNTAPDNPLEMLSAIFGTNTMNAEPAIEPGSHPTPPTTIPKKSAMDSWNVYPSGATN